MQLSRRSRTILGVVIVIGLVGYLVIVDVGVFAGRIHAGVSVDGIDVGGATLQEATDLLQRPAERLRNEDITFSAGSFRRTFSPSDIGWRPRYVDSAQAALEVGRVGWPFRALADRFTALTRGVTVEWRGGVHRPSLRRLVRSWARDARAMGLMIDRGELRRRIRAAIVTSPRREFEIPLRPG